MHIYRNTRTKSAYVKMYLSKSFSNFSVANCVRFNQDLINIEICLYPFYHVIMFPYWVYLQIMTRFHAKILNDNFVQE